MEAESVRRQRSISSHAYAMYFFNFALFFYTEVFVAFLIWLLSSRYLRCRQSPVMFAIHRQHSPLFSGDFLQQPDECGFVDLGQITLRDTRGRCESPVSRHYQRGLGRFYLFTSPSERFEVLRPACLYVYLFAYLKNRIPNFTKFFARVVCGRRSVLF